MSNILAAICRRLCANRASMDAAERTAAALRQLAECNPTCRIMTTTLSDVVLGKNVVILNRAILDKVSISDFSYISSDSSLSNVDIGKFCSISSGVQIGLSPHPSKVFVSTYPAFYSNDNLGCTVTLRGGKIFDDSVPKTTLGNDIWIGANVIIPGGIRIGTGAIVAAGAVVVKDVPPYAVVGGNPAKIIRYRFPDEQIKLLVESGWWNWPIEKLRQHVDDFSDIGSFAKLCGKTRITTEDARHGASEHV